MKKVGIYIRVSTTEQMQEGYSIPAQKEKLIAYCKAKDWLVQDIYIDGGYSGSNTDRPALNRLLDSLKDIDIVLVYKLDRLSRSQKDTLYLIEDKFISNNVDFVSITENFDTTTPFGRAMIGILSVFAQLERENIKERTKMGRIERAKLGLWCGAPNPPIGYDLIDSTLIINEYEAKQVRELFDLYIKGYGKDRIQNVFRTKGYGKKYGSWDEISNHTVPRIIKNRTYLGEVSFAKKWYKGIHTPIIDIDTFDKANKCYASRREGVKLRKYFLSGLLYCSECGGKYVTDIKNDKATYVCINRKRAYKQDLKCKNKIFPINVLEEMAIDRIKSMIKNKEEVIEGFKILNVKEETVDNNILLNRMNDIDKQINKLMDLYQLDNIPLDKLTERIEKLSNEKQSLKSEIKIDPIIVGPVDIKEILDLLEDFDVVWNGLDFIQKNEIAKDLFGTKILVNDKGI